MLASRFLLLCLFIQPVSAQTLRRTPETFQDNKSSREHTRVLQQATQEQDGPEANAAVQNAGFGFAHTPKGNLHLMIIYVGFKDATSADDEGEPYPWKHDTLPQYAMGNPSYLIDSDPAHPTHFNNLSTWFSTMSAGHFTITGEPFWVTVDKPMRGKEYDFFEIYKRAFKALEQQYPDEDWARFDQRQNIPAWMFDNATFNQDGTPASGDGIIDYAVVSIRNIGGHLGRGVSDASIFSGNTIHTTSGNGRTYQLGAGHTTDYMPTDWEHHHEYFRHEFSHVLFNSPHYFGANNLCGLHFYTNMGWGLMGALHKPMVTTNAWEKWYLGWNVSQEIDSNGTYQLNDFVTANDAIRIRIPGTDQYLFLENHQQIDPLDDKLFYKNESPMGKGIYAFISATGNDRGKPGTFFAANSSNTNNFKVLSAKGNWDYSWTDQQPYRRFDKIKENPIAGQTDLTLLRKDFKPGDHIISINNNWNNAANGSNEQDGVLNDAGTINYAWSGSTADAFRIGDEISLSGIVPALNYPFYDEYRARLDTFFLNGLSIQITDHESRTGSYTLNIRFDDVWLRNNKRWCGNLALNDLTNNSQPDLVIRQGTTLLLDKSGTPNTHTMGKGNMEFPDFIRPSCFTVNTHAFLLLQQKSRIIVADNSVMNLSAYSKLELQGKAELIFKDESRLHIDAQSEIILDNGSKITFEEKRVSVYRLDGKIMIKTGKQVSVFNGTIKEALTLLNSK